MLSTLKTSFTFRCLVQDTNKPLTSSSKHGAQKATEKKNKDRLEAATGKFLKFCSFSGIGMSSLLGGYSGLKAGMSPAGRIVMAYVNGMGGGTLKNMFQGDRAYWLKDTRFAWWTLGFGVVGALFWDSIKKRTGLSETDKWALAISLLSLGGNVCSGTQGGIAQGGTLWDRTIRGAVYSVVSAVGGGIVKDAFCGKRSGSLYPEGYANILPAIVGSFAYQAGSVAGLSHPALVGIGFGTSVPLRLYMANQYKKKMVTSRSH